MGFLSLFLNNKSLVGIVILVVILAGMGIYVKILKSNLEVCQQEKETISAKFEISQASVKSLQSAIDDQNSAVQKMKDAADAKEKLYLAEIARVKKNSDLLRQQAGDIMKRQPPQGVSKCDAANSLISEEITRAKK